MPRSSTIAQADIARALRAFRGLGVEAEVRILPDGSVIIAPTSKTGGKPEAGTFDNGEEIRL